MACRMLEMDAYPRRAHFDYFRTLADGLHLAAFYRELDRQIVRLGGA